MSGVESGVGGLHDCILLATPRGQLTGDRARELLFPASGSGETPATFSWTPSVWRPFRSQPYSAFLDWRRWGVAGEPKLREPRQIHTRYCPVGKRQRGGADSALAWRTPEETWTKGISSDTSQAKVAHSSARASDTQFGSILRPARQRQSRDTTRSKRTRRGRSAKPWE